MYSTIFTFMIIYCSFKCSSTVGLPSDDEPESVPITIIDDVEDVITTVELSPDGRFNYINLAAEYGFSKCENEYVITEDGYILSLQHIPGDPQRPVLLAHGNTADSSSWIDRGNTSLAIALARKGYDVWALNYRGTTLSKRHVTLDADKQPQQFFNYSFYEMGIYDLPATIDFILDKTNQTQLLAVGHSVGTTTFYVLGSERPEYNDKIKAFISLAPISFLQHIRGLAKLSDTFGDLLTTIAKLLGVTELDGKNQQISRAFTTECLGPDGYLKCVLGIIFPTFGFDPPGFEPEFVHTFFGHYPEGTSEKLFTHLFQIIKQDKFIKFDYGPEGNQLEYGVTEPPVMDLSKVSMKVALFAGREDYLATVQDAERLRCALPNVVHYQVMPYESFNHLDFVFGRFMDTNLYPYLLPVIEKYID